MARGRRGRGVPRRPDGAGRNGLPWAVMALHLGLSPVLFSVATHDDFELPKVSLLIATAAVLAVLLLAPRAGAWSVTDLPAWLRELSHDPLGTGIALVVVSAVASTLFSTSLWTSLLGADDSHAGLPTVVSYVVLFAATRHLARTTTDARRLLAAPVLGASLAGSYGLLQVLGADPITWTRTATLGADTRVFGTMGHPNLLSGYLAMVLPLVVFFAIGAWSSQQRWTASCLGLAGLLAMLLIVLSASRGAWLAAIAACAILLVPTVALHPRRALVAVGLGAAATAAGLGLLLVAVPAARGLLEGLGQRVAHLASSPSRLEIWATALRVFRSHPLVGAGLDTFQLAFQRERRISYWLAEWGATPQRAHNGVLQVLATQGLLGATAVALAAIGLAHRARRAWAAASPERRALLWTVVAGLVAYAVQVLFSFTVAAVGALVATLAGVLAGPAGRGVEEEQAPAAPRWVHAASLASVAVLGPVLIALNLPASASPLIPFGLLLVAASVGVSLVRVEWVASPADDTMRPGRVESVGVPPWVRASRWLAALLVLAWVLAFGVVRPLQASQALKSGERLVLTAPREALGFLEKATELDPHRASVWLKLAQRRLGVAEAMAEGAERQRLLADALAAAARARDLVPASANAHAGVGAVLLTIAPSGQPMLSAEGLTSFDRAIALDPANVELRVQAARMARLAGNPDRARTYIEGALAQLPNFGAALAERAVLSRDEGRTAETVAWLEKAVAGVHGSRESLVGSVANLASAYYAAGRYAEALPVAQRAVALDPAPDLRFNLGRILEALGRASEAEAEYRRALAADPGYVPARQGLERVTQPTPSSIREAVRSR